MQRIELKQDNLNTQTRLFSHEPLKQPVFLNSIPKSGSHLLRNILRIFVPLQQHFKYGFIHQLSMDKDKRAWDKRRPTLSWGHLMFSDQAVINLKDTRKILLVRDPYDWVLARARFFMSEEFKGNVGHISGDNMTAEEWFNLMIFGIQGSKETYVPSMNDIYSHNGVAWMHTSSVVLKFEDLIQHVKNANTAEAEVFFRELLDACGIEMPDDWRERVRVGSDPRQSGTARQNLTGIRMELPDELPQGQRDLIDFAAPGVRRLLGYE